MRKFLRLFKDHFREDFQLPLYLYTFLFLISCTILNYSFNFENAVLNKHHGDLLGMLIYFLFYAFGYFAIAIPQAFFKKDWGYFKNGRYWIKAISILAIISIGSGFAEHKEWVKGIEDIWDRSFTVRNLSQLRWVGIYLPFLILLKICFRKDEEGFYGFSFKTLEVKPYLVILLFVLPLATVASFMPDFQEAYPRFKPWAIKGAWGLEKWQLGTIFETVYGSGYIATEFIFRGALIIGLARYGGKNVILPMVAVYCFYHYGKPFAESISSIFGGLALGIIAYRTRNIIGGIMLHLGLAWMMELTAYLQHYFNPTVPKL